MDLAAVVARSGFTPLRHRGWLLVDTACALAAGATALTYVEALTRQSEIYGSGGGAFGHDSAAGPGRTGRTLG